MGQFGASLSRIDAYLIALARALYRLGDADGLGERALRSYLTDPRRVYARHAEELLSEPPR